MVTDELLSKFVKVQGRDTWLYMTANLGEGFTHEEIGLTHQFNLILCLQKYMHFIEED